MLLCHTAAEQHKAHAAEAATSVPGLVEESSTHSVGSAAAESRQPITTNSALISGLQCMQKA